MAHWAELDENNKVLQVTVGDNNDPAGDEGYQWLLDNLGGRWIKTSYNTVGGVHRNGGIPFRKNYAEIGSIYDEIRDAFISPKPYQSWILNDQTCLWQPPIPYPTSDQDNFVWSEITVSWELDN